MFGSEYFDDPTAAPRLAGYGGNPGHPGDSENSAGDIAAGGVWTSEPPPQDVMTFTDVAIDPASQARVRQIADRIEQLAAVDEASTQEQAEITDLLGELARLTGTPIGEPPWDPEAPDAVAADPVHPNPVHPHPVAADPVHPNPVHLNPVARRAPTPDTAGPDMSSGGSASDAEVPDDPATP